MIRWGLLAAIAMFFVACEAPPSIPKAVFQPDVIFPVDAGEDAGIKVSVATWNVEGFDLGGQNKDPGTYAGIARVLADASVEIVALEEVQVADLSKFKSALAATGPPLTYVTCSSESDGYNALAVASSYPILSAEEILPPSSTTWPRSVFKVKIDIGKGLTLFVCHLKADSKSQSYATTLNKRFAEAAALGNYIRDNYANELATESLIVLGDLNTTNLQDVAGDLKTLSLLSLRDDSDLLNNFTVFPDSIPADSTAWTWEGNVSGVWTQSSLDHIILSPAASARYVDGSLRIYRSDPNVSLQANSDHYPVVLDMSL